jgi:hypothetical protein
VSLTVAIVILLKDFGLYGTLITGSVHYFQFFFVILDRQSSKAILLGHADNKGERSYSS